VQGIEAASRATAASGQTPEQPADARAEREEVGAGRQPGEREAQREVVGAQPPALFQEFPMDDSDRGAAAAQGEVCVADEDVGDLRQSWSGTHHVVRWI